MWCPPSGGRAVRPTAFAPYDVRTTREAEAVSGIDDDRDVLVRCRRAVVGAGAQHICAGHAECDFRRHSAVARHRRREPHRSPRGVGADPQVFPGLDLWRIELHRARPSQVKPGKMQAVALTDAALTRSHAPDVYRFRRLGGGRSRSAARPTLRGCGVSHLALTTPGLLLSRGLG